MSILQQDVHEAFFPVLLSSVSSGVVNVGLVKWKTISFASLSLSS
jgi:hypothetical protein